MELCNSIQEVKTVLIRRSEQELGLNPVLVTATTCDLSIIGRKY